MHFKILQAKQRSKKKHLSRPHCGFEGGETGVEGAKNGDHALGDILALLQRLSDKCGSLAQDFHRLWNPHWRRNYLRISLPMRLVGGRRWKWRCVMTKKPIQKQNSTSFGFLFRLFQVSRRNAGKGRKMNVVTKSYSLSVYGPRLYIDGPP